MDPVRVDVAVTALRVSRYDPRNRWYSITRSCRCCIARDDRRNSVAVKASGPWRQTSTFFGREMLGSGTAWYASAPCASFAVLGC
jgi:hypothetical protein